MLYTSQKLLINIIEINAIVLKTKYKTYERHLVFLYTKTSQAIYIHNNKVLYNNFV